MATNDELEWLTADHTTGDYSDSDTDPGYLDSMMSADEAILLNMVVPEPGEVLACPWDQPGCDGRTCTICRAR